MIVKLYRMKKLEISIPIYDREVTVLMAEDLNTIDNYIEDCYNVLLEGKTNVRSASTYTLPDGVIIIGITNTENLRGIVHECGHATFEVLNLIGINPVTDQETFCYIQDYLFDKISKWRTTDA